MSTDVDLKTKPVTKTEPPKLHKVILLNDDYTPRDFVVEVLKAVFKIGPERAYGIMMTAHQKGSCVVSVYPAQIAETKANEANDMSKRAGQPLQFTTEPED